MRISYTWPVKPRRARRTSLDASTSNLPRRLLRIGIAPGPRVAVTAGIVSGSMRSPSAGRAPAPGRAARIRPVLVEWLRSRVESPCHRARSLRSRTLSLRSRVESPCTVRGYYGHERCHGVRELSHRPTVRGYYGHERCHCVRELSHRAPCAVTAVTNAVTAFAS